MKYYTLILLAGIILVSCNRGSYSRLKEIESYIEVSPEHALEELCRMKPYGVKGARNIAKHALLYSMALDKNYIDITTDSIIAPAVKYYSNHGSADERLLMHYYMGRIYTNAGNLENAAIEYSKGEKLVSQVSNFVIIGRLYSSFAEIYNSTQDSKKELEYVSKAYDYFVKSGNEKHCRLTKGMLAMAYANARDFEKADSLYREAINLTGRDTFAIALFLENYARLNVLKPNPDPQKALSLLERRYREYKKRPVSADFYYVYAYALQQLGREKECDDILEQLSEVNSVEKDYWQYLVNRYRGQYEQAIGFLEKSSKRYERQMIDLLSNTIDDTLKDYYAAESEKAKADMHIRILILVLIILSVSTILSLVAIKLMLNNRKKQQEMESYLHLYENAKGMLDKYDAQIGEQNNKLEEVKASYIRAYKNQFSTIGELCLTYLTKQNKKDIKDYIYRKVEKLIANISADEKLHRQLEKQLNAELDSIVSHLREDLPQLSNDDMRFICYCIIGFDATLISVILNLSIENVYTKKSRIKTRINALDSPYKGQYLMFL